MRRSSCLGEGEAMPTLIAPKTLVGQKKYIWDPCHAFHSEVTLGEEQTAAVHFLEYTACPAIVIIMDAFGYKKQVERDELFEIIDTSRTVT
jgi:hypothetical protein